MTQRFTTDPTSVVQAGSKLEICYTNAARTGENVTVNLANGDSSSTDTVEIQLDANGHGCVEWDVPASGWDSVGINGVGTPPDSDEKVVAVS